MASFVNVGIVVGIFLLLIGGGVDEVQGQTVHSALLTKTHTPAPPPPFRECACSSSPCHHGGVCTNKRIGEGTAATIDFECDCKDEWTGDVCTICNTVTKEIMCTDVCPSRKNQICEDGGEGSIVALMPCDTGTDCADCFARCLLKV
ncbi:fibropellin-3 [Strongylocentrotus purpuratus]|uniref:EGF-like domain-containing protein n=1 Tax=Strongylocentrotus purpuratus TaxID=7668 RepID=A0A7M7LLP9_STRPU|nr:fibropellin-3 [Strongylocentrotus purpuratus]